jgi:hypothetical protein
MSTSLKQEIIDKINATEDINLLKVVKSDIDNITEFGSSDLIDELANDDRNELINLAKEPDDFEVISQSEFDKMMAKWLTKQFIKSGLPIS